MGSTYPRRYRSDNRLPAPKGPRHERIPPPSTRHDLDQLLTSATPLRVIDVRTPGEFETAHIAGSYNVPLDLLREHRDEIVKHLDQQVVLVCRSGQRAAQAEVTLREAGLCNVHILDGGITSWEARGFAVTRGAQRWDLERQVRLVAGSIVLTSVLGSIAVPKLKWLAGAIGGGLTFAALSNTCAMGMMLASCPTTVAPPVTRRTSLPNWWKGAR